VPQLFAAAGAVAAGLLQASKGDLAAATCHAPAAFQRHTSSAARGGFVPPLEAALLHEEAAAAADVLALSEAAAAAELAASLSGQQFVATDNIAALPMGQSLRQEASVRGRPWAFETGKLARLANGSCLVQAGGTTVLAAATSQPPPWSRRDALNLQLEVRSSLPACWLASLPARLARLLPCATQHKHACMHAVEAWAAGGCIPRAPSQAPASAPAPDPCCLILLLTV
jgi:hypothetical protein